MSTKQLRVKLVKSFAGRPKKHQACIRGLGLRRIGHTVTLGDTPSIRGMINKVSYLLEVEEPSIEEALHITEPEFDWDSLSSDEGEYMQTVIAEIMDFNWAKPLLQHLEKDRRLRREDKWLLLEIRFAYELHRAGIAPIYEASGEGDSKIDFQFDSDGTTWNVELMRFDETDAVKGATHTVKHDDGFTMSQRMLSSFAKDETQSEEGETLKAIQRICQKCEKDGRPHKFKVPIDDTINVILVDFRNFLEGMGDAADMKHITTGGNDVHQFARRYFDGRPITGAFDNKTRLKGCEYLRERVHLIGFVKEKKYTRGEFRTSIHFVPNPHLLNHPAKATEQIKTWPFSDTKLVQ